MENRGESFEIAYLCYGCGADYRDRPQRCKKCGSFAIEEILKLKIDE